MHYEEIGGDAMRAHGTRMDEDNGRIVADLHKIHKHDGSMITMVITGNDGDKMRAKSSIIGSFGNTKGWPKNGQFSPPHPGHETPANNLAQFFGEGCVEHRFFLQTSSSFVWHDTKDFF